MSKKVVCWIIIVLSLIGLGTSIHLLQIDYNVNFDPNYAPKCDISAKVSCSKIAESEYSNLFAVPVASWGILGYLLILFFMFTSKKSKRLYSSLMIFFSIFSLGSVYFFIVAKVIIGAVCLFCLTIYAVNLLGLALLLFAVFKLQYDEEKFCLKDNIKTFF